MTIVSRRFRPIAAAGALLLSTAAASSAEDMSRWDGDGRSAARLIAGSPAAGGIMRAGVEIRLKNGWHTYWRHPGDAGVPPRFDFKASQNVGQVDVLWPAPRRITEASGVALGYANDVIFPLQVVPQDAGKPVVLRLKLDYAVCEKLCVPAEAKAELALAKGLAPRDGTLAAAEMRVPKKVALGEGHTLAIRAVRRETGSARPRLVVDVAAPPGIPVDLFAEGPTPQWALPVPARVDGAPAGIARFAFDLDGLPPGVNASGALIVLTATAQDRAIEVAIRLD
jgi:DsbC/DsbD-like thiol-disulfide interchange protein